MSSSMAEVHPVDHELLDSWTTGIGSTATTPLGIQEAVSGETCWKTADLAVVRHHVVASVCQGWFRHVEYAKAQQLSPDRWAPVMPEPVGVE